MVVVGDDIHLHPTAPPMRIEIVDPPNGLVLFGSPAKVGGEGSWGMSTWQFVINPGPDGGCRLLTRGRYDYSPDWTGRSCRAGWQVRQDERPYEVDFDENDNRTRSGGRSCAMRDIWTTNLELPTGSAASGRGLS